MHERFILTNAIIISMDASETRYDCVAVDNGRIAALGSQADLAHLIHAGWPAYDMQGQTILPGFIDTHQHLGLTGQVLNGIDLRDADCLDTVYDRVSQRASITAADAWVLGYSMNELNLREARVPLKEELDAASPDRPVMLVHASWHLCMLNSLALDLLNLPPDLPGMDIGPNGPTGVVRDPGALSHVFPMVNNLTPERVRLAGYEAACHAALKQGITSMHCLEGGEFGPGGTRVVVANQSRFPVHTIVWNQVMDIEETVELGLPRIGGCICADGAMSAQTAAVLEPYSHDPDNYGSLNFTQEQMDDFILHSHRAGLQVAIHCEMDGAVEQVLTAMERAIAAHPRDNHRHRIEHCEIPTEDQMNRMAAAGIIASMQPSFLPYLVVWDDYIRWFGPERMQRIQPYRTMLDKGIVMCGGSDGPITPYSPLKGVQSAVMHPVPEQALTVTEALRMFTSDAAYSGFDETERGSIEVGKIADLVVLAADLTAVAPETIADIPIAQVYIAGKPTIEEPLTQDKVEPAA